MSGKEETALSKAICDAINVSGLARVWRQQSGTARGGKTRLAPKGSSDLVGYMLDGTARHVALEVKTATGFASAEQLKNQREVHESGGVAAVVRSTPEAISFLIAKSSKRSAS